MANNRKTIAKNIAAMLNDGDVVNLGIGIPTMVSNYVPDGMTILLHGENGCIGQDKTVETPWPEEYATREEFIDVWKTKDGDWKTGHRDRYNASNELIALIPGACCFDTVTSFGIARGGHLNATILGGLQVDQEGNLASWSIPGVRTNGMGGSMDLVSGAKKVIVAMEHTSKDGSPKFLKKCTFPLTAVNCVSVLVTERCIVEFQSGKPVVTAMAPGETKESLQAATGAELTFADQIRTMDVVD